MICNLVMYFGISNTFTNSPLINWSRLPRGVVDSPSLEIFKTCLDSVLCNLLWVNLL